jgi:phosphoribosylamine--glycine ligase
VPILLVWYEEDGQSPLFQKTLAKLKPCLQEINFKGDIDVDFIINQDGVFPIEATARFGCPSTQLQAQLHQSPWREILLAVAKGEQHNLKYKKGYGIIVSVAIPPFPYKAISQEYYLRGVDILFKGSLTESEMDSIHFEEVSLKNHNSSQYCIAGSNGYILYVSGIGKTIQEARENVYRLVDKIVIPKMFYRTDIGVRFIERDRELLKKWGYLTDGKC